MSSSSIPESEGVVVISCDQLPPQNIISRILGNETLPSATYCSNIKGYLWNLETKYYSAEVYLYALDQKEKLDPKLCETIKAIIFYIDNIETTNFDDVKNWMPYLKDIEAEVQLLICNVSSEESKSRKSILNWCVQNQFELVELNSSVNEEEDDFILRDAKGFDRVIQSLQSHLWANLSMKEKKSQIKNNETGELIDSKEISGPQEKITTDVGEASAANSSDDTTAKKESNKTSTKVVKVDDVEVELEEQLLSKVLTGEDPGEESFEALFEKLASLKDRANGLNGEERKKYAEKMTIAFWRAIGGDEDEIDGLDDD